MKTKGFAKIAFGFILLVFSAFGAYKASFWAIKESLAEIPDRCYVEIPISDNYIIQPFGDFSPSGFIVRGFSVDSLVSLATESRATLLIGWDKNGKLDYYLPKENSFLSAYTYIGTYVAKNWDFVFSVDNLKTELVVQEDRAHAYLVFYPEKGAFQSTLFLIIWGLSIAIIFVLITTIGKEIRSFTKRLWKTVDIAA